MEQLSKLRPDRDLQCYFERPSAVAAISGASANGFTVSGCWRQQFDWAVIEWNRDNVFEHPLLRNLPDGDLSGVSLSYEETRVNCIAMDSALYPTVDWPYLRIWTETSGSEPYRVPLKDYATVRAGEYHGATLQFELQGAPTAGDYIELAWLDQHFNYQLTTSDTLVSAVAALAATIDGFSASNGVHAAASGAQITLSYPASAGMNANRIGAYGTVSGAATEVWSPAYGTFSGGASPTRWRVELNFANLRDLTGSIVPTTNVRKIRWTWAADLQAANFVRSEFAVNVTDWRVTGSGTAYQVAGPGSRRIEDDSRDVAYQGDWTEARGNYSGGSIRQSTKPGALIECTYTATGPHTLLMGTRRAGDGATVSARIDQGASIPLNLQLSGEDVLVRLNLGQFGGGTHTVQVSHCGPNGSCFYFDFLEIAYPTPDLPAMPAMHRTTLATDWDTDHSISLAPERTAWLIQKLGFFGRANHYAGAMWFYELVRPGHRYANAAVTFAGAPNFAPAPGLAASLDAARVAASDSAFTAVAATTTLLCVISSLTAWFTVPGQALPWPRQSNDSRD